MSARNSSSKTVPPTDVAEALEAYRKLRALPCSDRVRQQLDDAEVKALNLLTPELIENDPDLFFWALEMTRGRRSWRDRLGIGPESFFIRFHPGDNLRAWAACSEKIVTVVSVNPSCDQVVVVDSLGEWDLWRIKYRAEKDIWIAESGNEEVEIRPA